MNTLKEILSGFPLTLLAICSLTACQSNKNPPNPNPKNFYAEFLLQQKDAQLLKKISNSPYNLMRATYNEFVKDVNRQQLGFPSLGFASQGLIHGDFHPLQMARRQGKAELDDWDTVSQGPLWQDIVRMESSALLLSKDQGLRAYPDLPCWNAYSSQFVRNIILSPLAKPLEPSQDQKEVYKDFSIHPVWQSAESIHNLQPDLLVAIENWLDNESSLPINNQSPKKRLKSGVGSLLKEKIIFLDAQKQLWELKEVTGEIADSGCGRFQLLEQNFKKRPSQNLPIKKCWDWNQRTFVLLKWDQSYWSPKHTDFENTTSLVNHVQWMCSELAQFHKASLSTQQAREWSLSIYKNPVFENRIRKLSHNIATSYLQAFEKTK